MTKRILAISPTFYPQMGGVERVIDELYSRLPEHGTEVDLITPNLGGPEQEVMKKGFTVYRAGTKVSWYPLKFIWYQFVLLLQGLRLLRQRKYDVIHNQFVAPTGLVAVFLAWKARIPLVTSIHHFGTGMDIIAANQNPCLSNPLMRFILRRSDKIITTGVTQNKFLKFLFDGIPKNTTTIKLGSPPVQQVTNKRKEQLKKKHGVAGKKVIFSIGRLTKRKRFDEILNVAQHMKKDSSTIFLIAGKGPEFDALQKEAASLPNVNLLGFIDDKTRQELFLLADIFAYCSVFEGSGIVYTEAMSFGVPVVAYHNEAVSDIISDDSLGLLVPSQPSKMADAIRKLLKSPVKAKRIVKVGHELVKKVHNWDVYARQHEKVFNSL